MALALQGTPFSPGGPFFSPFSPGGPWAPSLSCIEPGTPVTPGEDGIEDYFKGHCIPGAFSEGGPPGVPWVFDLQRLQWDMAVALHDIYPLLSCRPCLSRWCLHSFNWNQSFQLLL